MKKIFLPKKFLFVYSFRDIDLRIIIVNET